jgi:protein disulfide-isomerase
MTVLIQVWFDVVCPFCYIGKRRLSAAIARLSRPQDARVAFHAFQLSPEAPAQTDEDLNSLLQQRYGMTRAQAIKANAEVGEQALSYGLKFDFTRARWANTRNAHRLVKLAAHHGRGGEMVEAVSSAFFVEGLRIGESGALLTLGARVGLPDDEVAALLAGDRFDEAISRDRAEATREGLRGVPFFVVGGERGGSEMVTPANLERLLRQERHKLG